MKLISSLVIAGLLAVNGFAYAGTPSSSTPVTTTENISSDLFADGKFNVSNSFSGDRTFVDNYTFDLNSQGLQEFNSLSASLNYTNSNSVGCALLIFCGVSNTGFNNLSVTLTTPAPGSTTTSGTTTTGSTNTSVFVIPVLVWSSTTSTQNTVSTDWISLLSTGTYTLSVSGTTLRNGGAYSLGVTAVPEPQTAALAALGLGLIGIIARRRRA